MTLWEIANAEKLGPQVSVARAAKHCDCTTKHIRNMISRGELEAHKFGGKVLITLQSLIEALKPIAYNGKDNYLRQLKAFEDVADEMLPEQEE